MIYVMDALKMSPLWVGAIFLFASQAPGEMFGDEWRDMAVLFAGYVLMCSIGAIIVVRLIMWLSQQSYRHH